MREDLRAALDRAGDAEERAARAEMALFRLQASMGFQTTTTDTSGPHGPTAEDLMKTALEVRDACRAKERSLAVLLRSFRKTFEKTDGFDPRHCQPTVEKDNVLLSLYETLR